MKKRLASEAVLLIGFFILSGLSYGQYMVQSIPPGDRVAGIDIVFMRRMVDEAGDLVNKKGEEAFAIFRKPNSKWNDGAPDLYVVNAIKGHDDEGAFLVYPSPDVVKYGGLEMVAVNGRPLVKFSGGEEDSSSFNFIPPSTSDVPNIVKIVQGPKGRSYALATGHRNLLMHAHFVHLLVDSACRLIEQEGEKAFQTLERKDTIYRFRDTYIFVQTGDQDIISCPGDQKLVGKKLSDTGILVAGATDLEAALKSYREGDFPTDSKQSDINLKRIMINNGHAWGVYQLPRPGEDKPSAKASYFRLIKAKGKEYIVGCGIYLADLGIDIE